MGDAIWRSSRGAAAARGPVAKGFQMSAHRPIPSDDLAAPARIWYQSFVDPQEQRPYMLRLQEQLAAYAAPHVRFDVHGVSPPDRYLSPLTEFRCAAQAIRSAIQAREEGYDAFVIGHFQEPGLTECRCALDVPVIGLGEVTMLYACLLARTFGLVTTNPVFIPWHRDQINRLGLGQRAVGVRAIDTQVATYMQAFEDEDAYQQVKADFGRQALPLVDAGAEVIIPAGGLPLLLLAREQSLTIQGAVVLNGIATVAAAAEAALKLFRLTGVAASRQGSFAKAPPEAIQEFLVIGPGRSL
jgi:allantoin racemase